MDECDDHDIALFTPREEAPQSFEPAEQPFDLIASCIQGSSLFPWRESIVLGRHHRPIPYLHGQLPRRIAFIRPIHSQVDRARHSPDAVPPLPPLGRIVGLARGQGNRDGRSRLRGHQMNRGRPSAAGPATGVRAVFCNAPVPSGWTLTLVRSKATASIFTRRI
jgi:hypothetical protein